MADINTVATTDTFDTWRSVTNSVVTKLNTIQADADTLKFTFSTSEPADTADAQLSDNEAIIYLYNNGTAIELRVKYKLAGSDPVTQKVTLTTVT